MEGKSCMVTDRKETCLAVGSMAQMALLSSTGREITRDEAMSIIKQNQKQGLVLQLSNTEKAEFICSCCGYCSGMLDALKKIPNPWSFGSQTFMLLWTQTHVRDTVPVRSVARLAQ